MATCTRTTLVDAGATVSVSSYSATVLLSPSGNVSGLVVDSSTESTEDSVVADDVGVTMNCSDADDDGDVVLRNS